jgi:hypothetical protein
VWCLEALKANLLVNFHPRVFTLLRPLLKARKTNTISHKPTQATDFFSHSMRLKKASIKVLLARQQ